MVITRKIEVFICESDKDLRRSYYDKLYDIRNIAQKAANAATSHLFMLDNKIPYLDEAGEEDITEGGDNQGGNQGGGTTGGELEG